MFDVNYREIISTLKPQISVPQLRHALKYPHTCMVGLHDISFQHRYRDVHIRNSHIAGCAMFSRPILFVICIYTDCFLCSHTDTASTPDATAVQRYPFLNKFSSRATARFQCWKSIYPLLKLPRCRGER